MDIGLGGFFSQFNNKFGPKLLFGRTESSRTNRRQEIKIFEITCDDAMVVSSLVKLPIAQSDSILIGENVSDC